MAYRATHLLGRETYHLLRLSRKFTKVLRRLADMLIRPLKILHVLAVLDDSIQRGSILACLGRVIPGLFCFGASLAHSDYSGNDRR